MKNKSLLFLFVIIFICSVSYSQNGTRAIDYSTRSFGRGGTGIGFFDNSSLILTNPGGITFLKSTELTANSIFMFPSLSFKNYRNVNGVTNSTLLNDVNGDNSIFVLPSISYIQKFKDSKFTLGAGVFITGGMGADYSLKHELFKDAGGNYIPQTYTSRFGVIESGLSLAYKFNPDFSVGITGEFIYTTLKFTNPFSLSPAILKGQATPTMTFAQLFSYPRAVGGLGYNEVTSSANMKDLNSYSFGGKIGLAYKFNDVFSMGASYSMPVPLKFKNGKSDLDMTAQFTDASGRAVQNVMARYPGITSQAAKDTVLHQFLAMGINPANGFVGSYDLENSFKIPQSFGIGMMYALIPKLRFAVDFEWINWSKAFDKMSLVLRNGTNTNINKLLAAGGPGQPDLLVDFLLDWKDAVILKFGTEFDFSDKFTARVGYAYGSNPVPYTTAIPIIPAILEHHFTGGISYNFSKSFTCNLAFEYGLKKKQTASNPSLIAAEYNLSESSLQNLLGHISFTYNFK